MRVPRFLAAVALLSAFAAAARAELDATEKKWLKQCMESLTSKSAKVRDGGAAAIAKLGFDAIPELLPEVGRLKTDDEWSSLTSALAQMGAKAAADVVDMARDKWPKGQEMRLGGIVAQLRDLAPGVVPVPSSDVDAKVRELLEPFRTVNSYSSDEPAVRNVIALGRPAVPTLVAMIREEGREHGPGMLMHAVTDALARLATESDVPVLAQLLTEGRLVAARAFKHLRSPAALDALLVPVQRGFVSYELVEALDRFASEPRVAKALVEWLDAHGVTGGWEVSPVADFVDEHHVASAVDPLLKIAATSPDASVASKVGAALASLGRKEGIEMLLGVMEGAFGGHVGGHSDYERHESGEALNRIAGRRIYAGSFEPFGGLRGNADEAAKLFREWWTGAKDKIRFVETRRAWVVD